MFENYSLKFFILTWYGPFMKLMDSLISHTSRHQIVSSTDLLQNSLSIKPMVLAKNSLSFDKVLKPAT
jgi:hypothetical protein